MTIDKETYEKIAAEIHDDKSPVGIDAKKTHILILHRLEQMQEQLDRLETMVKDMQTSS